MPFNECQSLMNNTKWEEIRLAMYDYPLTIYHMNHFIPEESFTGHEETFIWTDVLYCSKNNILAVDGCFWARSEQYEFL